MTNFISKTNNQIMYTLFYFIYVLTFFNIQHFYWLLLIINKFIILSKFQIKLPNVIC